jgi:hypothetical protein
MKAFALPMLACALLAGAALPGTDANAAGPSPQATATQSTTQAAPLTDISTAKKKKHHSAYHRGYYGAPGYGPQAYGPRGYGPPAYSMWRGADPSYGPGTAQLRQYQREGRCVIDEGYGRYSFCSNR